MSRTERASVEFEGRLIEYTVVRSARRKKTIEITLDPERGVLVRSPVRTTRKDIAELVQKRAGWILSHATEDILDPTPRRFTNGETLFYLGSELPIARETIGDTDVEIDFGSGALLRLTAPAEVEVRLEADAFRISVPSGRDEEWRIAATRAAIEKWYRKEAARLLPEMVAHWQSKVSRRKPTKVLVRNQRRRWGSCSSDGSIRLNWRIIMAERALIDYVVVHELAHLAVMDHSPRYWQEVERAMPDYRLRRKRLNEVGARFWL